MIYLALFCALASAPEPPMKHADSFIGSFHYADTENGDKAIVAAIEHATDELNFVVRPLARAKLKEKNAAPKKVSIRRQGAKLLLETPARSWATDLLSKPLTISLPGGRTGLVSKTLDGNALVEVLQVAQTTRENRYRLSEDGIELLVQVTIVTPRLTKPIYYELTYTRVPK